jgi:cell division protein FtsZ
VSEEEESTIQFAAEPRDGEVDEISIRVIGVGGGGGNAVNTMARSGLSNVRFIAANTDQQALAESAADEVLPLGVGLTRGLGAGARPEVGRDAARESRSRIEELVVGADMVFVTAGMGGGTGTGAAPVIAQVAREAGALCVAVVTRPFSFEGKRRRRTAEAGIEQLKDVVDTLVVIPNDRLVALAGPDMSTIDAFTLADEVLLDAVRGVVDLIHVKGVVNADFADVRTVMSIPGMAMMGMGVATGDLRSIEAAQRAISSPLLEEAVITGARGVLVNVTSNSKLRLSELTEAVTLIEEEAHEDAEVIFGWVVDESIGEEVRVTVLATGIESIEESRLEPLPEAVRPSIPRILKTEAPRPIPVSPWATLPAATYDLPPAVRDAHSQAPVDLGLLERKGGEVFQATVDEDMAHLDRPTFVRKLAD